MVKILTRKEALEEMRKEVIEVEQDLCICGHNKYAHEAFSQGRPEAKYCLRCGCNKFIKSNKSNEEVKKIK